MVAVLEEAIAILRQLPEAQQEQIARRLLFELQDQPEKELSVEEKLALLASFKLDVPVREAPSIRRVDWYGDDGR